MSLRRFMLAIDGVAILAAVTASAAPAAAVTGGTWHVEGVTNFVGPALVECEVGEHEGGETLKLTGFVGGTKVPITFTATGLDCVEASIFNDGVGGPGHRRRQADLHRRHGCGGTRRGLLSTKWKDRNQTAA